MWNIDAWEAPASNLGWIGLISEEDGRRCIKRHSLVLTRSAPTGITEATSIQSSPDLISPHLSRAQDQLQQARDLDKAGRFESANSHCRNVIQDSECASGINDPSYDDGIILLAEVYERSGDTSEATQLRQLADKSNQGLVQEAAGRARLRACVEEALSWVAMLNHGMIPHQY